MGVIRSPGGFPRHPEEATIETADALFMYVGDDSSPLQALDQLWRGTNADFTPFSALLTGLYRSTAQGSLVPAQAASAFHISNV